MVIIPLLFSGTEKSSLPRRVTGNLGSDNALSGDRQMCTTRRLERFNHSRFLKIHNIVLQCNYYEASIFHFLKLL